VDPRVTTGLTYEQLGLRPKFSVSAVLYIINFANCNQNGPQKAIKEVKEEKKRKESNHNRKEEGNCAEI
jgi:hypothetical protein